MLCLFHMVKLAENFNGDNQLVAIINLKKEKNYFPHDMYLA